MADKSQNFREVVVWQKAHAFTLAIYQTTESFPKHELQADLEEVSRLLQGYINGLERGGS